MVSEAGKCVRSVGMFCRGLCLLWGIGECFAASELSGGIALAYLFQCCLSACKIGCQALDLGLHRVECTVWRMC